MRRTTFLVVLVLVAAAVCVLVYGNTVGLLVVLLVAIALGVAGWHLVGRNQRAWGYTERADDLLVRRGVAFRQVTVVPYGRMQFVDVSQGPIQRRFELATVQLHTAAAKTDARIPGLTPAEAARLRDRLAARGESRAAGL